MFMKSDITRNQKKEKYAASLSTNRLKISILPTEKCNFRCVYCYEDYKQGAMTQSTVEAIKKMLSYKIQKLKMLNIDWFGGEPSLCDSIIVDISTHIQNLIREYPKLIYTSSMSTNGYLLNTSMLNKFCNLGITIYQISLDGTPENHNKTRILANGKGTFDTIWNNLLSAKTTDLDFSIMIRIHFFLDSYTEIIPLLTRINDTFLIDKRFKIFLKAIQRLGSKNDNEIKCITPIEESNIKNHLKKFINQKENIFDIDSSYVCYAAEPNAMIIRANGDINKCTVALNEPYNQVGKLNPDGTLKIDRKLFLAWSKGFQNIDTKCLNCPNQFMKKEYQESLVN